MKESTLISTSVKRKEGNTDQVEQWVANARMLNALYNSFVMGDVEHLTRFLAPDYIQHVPGTGGNAGEYWGVEGMKQFMSNIARHNGGLFQMEVPVFSISNEHAFTREVIRINRAQDPEREWILRICNWFKIRDGKVTESWVIPENLSYYDQYWTVDEKAIAAKSAGVRPPIHCQNLLDIDSAYSADNLHLIEHMYQEFWNGHMDAMGTLISKNVLVNIVGNSAISGFYRGWEGYLEFRNRLTAVGGNKYKLEVVGAAASSKDIWAVERIRMNRKWDPAVREIFVLMHFEVENGIITKMDDFPLDTYQWEDFYLRSA